MCSVALLMSLHDQRFLLLISATCHELSYSSIPSPGEHGWHWVPPTLVCRAVIWQQGSVCVGRQDF